MSRRLRWLLFGLPLALAALAVVAWLALDAWLESAGGRRAIEGVLSTQSGYPVRLAGAFDIVLLPSPGVSGTDLRVHDADGGAVLVSSGRYRVALALRPLLRRELHVDRLTLGDVNIGATDDPGSGFRVPELEITGFAVDRPADFRLDLGPLGEASGAFTWRPTASALDLQVAWGGFLFPTLSLDLRASYDAAGLWFEAMDALVDGQPVNGTGCYRIDDGSGLHLDLQAARLDLDALNVLLPETGDESGGADLPVRLRLSADEVVRGDVTARGVVMHLGDDPDCSRPSG